MLLSDQLEREVLFSDQPGDHPWVTFEHGRDGDSAALPSGRQRHWYILNHYQES
jgi:hypothetical protein